jgi:hypothetical protein
MKDFLSLTSYPHNLPVFIDKRLVVAVTALPAGERWQQRTRVEYGTKEKLFVEVVCEPAGEIFRQVQQSPPSLWQRITRRLFP